MPKSFANLAFRTQDTLALVGASNGYVFQIRNCHISTIPRPFYTLLCQPFLLETEQQQQNPEFVRSHDFLLSQETTSSTPKHSSILC